MRGSKFFKGIKLMNNKMGRVMGLGNAGLQTAVLLAKKGYSVRSVYVVQITMNTYFIVSKQFNEIKIFGKAIINFCGVTK